MMIEAVHLQVSLPAGHSGSRGHGQPGQLIGCARFADLSFNAREAS